MGLTRLMRFCEPYARAAVLSGAILLSAAYDALGGGEGMDTPVQPPRQRVFIGIDVPDIEEPDIDITFPDEDHVSLYNEDLPVVGECVIYVIDNSGSMLESVGQFTGLDGTARTGSRSDQAKVELTKSIKDMDERYEFGMVIYNCELDPFPVRQATQLHKAAAIVWLNAHRPGGGTNTGPAVAYALNRRGRDTIVLLSDGAPGGCGVDSDNKASHRGLIRYANIEGSPVHCIGIGAYGQFAEFLQAIARENGGRYFPVN